MKVGGAEQRVGLAERDFVGCTVADFMEPLQKYLDSDMKAIARERRLLDNKRLVRYIGYIYCFFDTLGLAQMEEHIADRHACQGGHH